MNKDTFDFENEIPETSNKKFADLDLGLDFDLSFLDDMDESILEDVPVAEAPPLCSVLLRSVQCKPPLLWHRE